MSDQVARITFEEAEARMTRRQNSVTAALAGKNPYREPAVHFTVDEPVLLPDGTECERFPLSVAFATADEAMECRAGLIEDHPGAVVQENRFRPTEGVYDAYCESEVLHLH